MFPHTILEPQDDPAFLTIVDRIVGNLVRQNCPDEVHLIHIDNWFDRKWLRFSGYGLVPFLRGNPYREVAKEEYNQDQKTFPPFTPNRVVAQYLFCHMADGHYGGTAAGPSRPSPSPPTEFGESAPTSDDLHKVRAVFVVLVCVGGERPGQSIGLRRPRSTRRCLVCGV